MLQLRSQHFYRCYFKRHIQIPNKIILKFVFPCLKTNQFPFTKFCFKSSVILPPFCLERDELKLLSAECWPFCCGLNVISSQSGVLSKPPEDMIRPDSRFAPSQWETALLCNDVSHWLGASLESALMIDGALLVSREVRDTNMSLRMAGVKHT